MNISALLTSAGINIGICVLVFSIYSILRKQPSNINVYFARRLTSTRTRDIDGFWFERFVPSAGWVKKAWETTEEEILRIGGLDAVAFNRLLVFSIRIFSIAAVVCMLLVLPVNYYGKDMIHKQIPLESLEVFTIVNVKEGSRWLWVHCVALYVISLSACALLYFEYKRITGIRLLHIMGSPSNLSHFTVLVRSIPRSAEESFSDSVKKVFTKYYGSNYLSHQMVYRAGRVQKLLNDAERMCKKIDEGFKPTLMSCVNNRNATNSFKISSKRKSVKGESVLDDSNHSEERKECPVAFVFFKTRYAAIFASKVLQSSNPMLWVVDMAPEPDDIYWSHLWIPYRQLWVRRIGTLLAAIALVFVFIAPVTFVQGLTQLEKLQKTFPFFRKIIKKHYMLQLVTGYLPSVILILFLYIIPPVMMLFSSVEGPISHSERKRSACCKVLYFYIWNVFFVNVFSGSLLGQLDTLTSPRSIPTVLAKAVPAQASFFITYVLTSGWASLSFEIMQIFGLLYNLFRKFILRIKDDYPACALSFPYHTELPRVLLLGLLGFTISIMAPMILPFLLIYFLLAYLVYRNQFLNVYGAKYESGGRYWPIIHNTTIFSLVLTQIIAIGVFSIKRSPVASVFTILLVICTLLFNEYCRQRFHPVFKNSVAEVFIEMDLQDEQNGTLEDRHKQLHLSYCQFPSTCDEGSKHEEPEGDPENGKPVDEVIQARVSSAVSCDPEGEPSKN